MIKIINTQNEDPFKALASRTIHRDDQTERIVKEIIEDVRQRGDQALLENARKFDAPGLESLLVSDEELQRAKVGVEEANAINASMCNIAEFHSCQIEALLGSCLAPKLNAHWNHKHWSMPSWNGSQLGQRIIPLNSVGVLCSRRKGQLSELRSNERCSS